MAVSKILPEKNWDTCIVGGGLVGWTVAVLALSRGRQVLLLEKSDKFGGRSSPEIRKNFVFGAGFVFGGTQAWQELGQTLDLGLEWLPVVNGGALIHGAKGWQQSQELPEWESYLSNVCTAYPAGGVPKFLQVLQNYCESKGAQFHAVTGAPVEEIRTNNQKVHQLLLGSGQEISCAELIWTADAKGLGDSLRGDGLPEEGVARVAWIKKHTKTHSSPAVVLEFAHKTPVAEFTETLFLPFQAGEKEERRYLAGTFVSQRDPSLAPAGKQLSQWIFALSEVERDDNHEMMKKIRFARRMLEKAFAGFEATITDERVLVLEHSFTPLSKRKGDYKPILENLFILADWASPYGSHWQGILELLKDPENALFPTHDR